VPGEEGGARGEIWGGNADECNGIERDDQRGGGTKKTLAKENRSNGFLCSKKERWTPIRKKTTASSRQSGKKGEDGCVRIGSGITGKDAVQYVFREGDESRGKVASRQHLG